ncbi:MAG: hypothetical protein IK048_03705 [Clostridia bacterium]|nr:hypothetical protein [Clostridia bacterium]
MEEQKFDSRTISNTEVIVGNDLYDELPTKIAEVSKEGAILVAYDKNLKQIAQKIADALRGLSRRIFLCELDKTKAQDDVLPDYIRYIVAVGCGFASAKADALSRGLNVGWSLFLTAPTTDTILRGKSPKHVFIDENVLINCPKACIAAGFGTVYARNLKTFENAFAGKVLAREEPPCLPFEIKGEISPVSLAILLLEISAMDEKEDGAGLIAKILYKKAMAEGKKPRLVGEYMFIAASYLLALYSSLLSSPAIDVLLPPVLSVSTCELEKIGCADIANRQKSIDFFDVNSYFRISYILAEYRTDLLEKLSAVDMHKSQRVWRRIYDDAGYFLKDALTAKDVKYAATLAGSLSDNLLGFAYACGVLNAV